MNDTLVRGMTENLPIDQIILEAKSLRLAYDATFSDCLELIFPLFLEGVAVCFSLKKQNKTNAEESLLILIDLFFLGKKVSL